MLRNHLTMALRVFGKQRLSSVITVAGLGIGLAFFALLAIFVRDELSFDRFHAKANRIYVLTSEFQGRFSGGAHHFVAGILESNYPEVKPGSTVRVACNDLIIRRGERQIVKDFAFVDPGFFGLFSFDLIAGDPARALVDPSGVVLTAAAAESLALGPTPMGKTLSIKIGETFRDFAITGIVRSIPGNSSLRFDGLLPFGHVFEDLQIDPSNTDFITLPMFATTFLELPDAAAAASLRAKLPDLSDRLYGDMWKKVKMEAPQQGLGLLPLPKYHLGDIPAAALGPRSQPSFSWILSGIAVLILILAGFNAVNLSLARSASRLKEMGVRKVVGARTGQIIGQLLTESLLAAAGALALGALAAALLLSSFNAVTGKRLVLSGLLHPLILAAMIGGALMTGLLTGFIPARVLSRPSAASILKGRLPGSRIGRLSLVLVIIQFTGSLVLLIGTGVMLRQLRFMTKADLGYDPANVIVVATQISPEEAPRGVELLEIFRNTLRPDPRILAVTADSGIIADGNGGMTRRYDKDGDEHIFEAFQADIDYFQALNIPLVAGRGLSAERAAEIRDGVLVNEALIRDFALKNPVGKRFSEFARDKLPAEYSFDPQIIGVVRDFHVASLHEPIAPMAFGPRGFLPFIQRYRRILVKFRPGESAAVREALEKIWSGVRPDLPFRAEFLEDALAAAYSRERQWNLIVGWAGGVALFISCLGLFGMTALSVVRRTKEIGIRKAVGAGRTDILLLFLRENLRWMASAVLLACPIAWYISSRWLEQFAYRIHPDIATFAGAVLTALSIAGLSVGGLVGRAAGADPARNLRYE
ncbi:MAG: ABC transporter permease [Candidatus Aminicenantes bacterium]|nr:ABC transporter permease [Candidatus Aminicenantes bacterium]